ncbi:MAG: PA2779 family protein [Sulfuricaulis sp.]|uniref:PA2779 family protein n=1 Tax=Sulfuricaulis sp. TaxID=2003553 RepID=UPI0025E3B6E4|nr:PA2779 family protein [Sulfuricaulis sp.]MCR4346045.1 PA2779 family protein [Sulfuricaulis sp.]
MKILKRFTNPLRYAMAASMLAISLPMPAANAAMVGTEAAINTAPAQQETERIREALNREEVKAKLLSLGVDPAQIQARVDALTEVEAQALAKHADEMPAAGADTVTWLLIILLIVLII